MPRVVENMLDAKAELDGRLRSVINDFVNGVAARITAPLTETSNGRSSAKGDALDPKRATTAVRGLAEKEVPFLRHKLSEYILLGCISQIHYDRWQQMFPDEYLIGSSTTQLILPFSTPNSEWEHQN